MTKLLNFALKIKGVVGRVAHAKSSDPATSQKKKLKRAPARGLLQSFFEQDVMKNKGYEHFYFLFKMADVCRGYNLGSGKQFSAIKGSFHFIKPGFRGLMVELVTCSLLERPTFMTSYLYKQNSY